MNCRDFERRLADLVRGHEMDQAARRLALSHAESCQHCCSRLSDERALVGGLAALAKEVRQYSQPCSESEILRRYLELDLGKRIPPPGRRANRLSQSKWARSGQWIGYAGIAASCLMALGWLAMGTHRSRPKQQLVQTPQETARSLAGANREPEKEAIGTTRELPTQPTRVKSQSDRVKPLRRAASITQARGGGSTHRDVATEFLPFMTVEPPSPTEVRQLVRVRLPRTAVLSFGLPVNMERSREPVQADVLLGEDGRALAVRFVRD